MRKQKKENEKRRKEKGREGERREEARGDPRCWDLRESQGRKKGENKLKAKLYSHKKMELFLNAVPPRYEEKEG